MVSIITPVYNAEKFLHEAIDSVLNQTYKDWELILVDDGSTDSSGEICRQVARSDKRIRCYHTINRGVSEARNLGLSVAKGDYISFLDADDILHPLFLEWMTDVINSNTITSGEKTPVKMDMVWCRMNTFSKTSDLLNSARFTVPFDYSKYLKKPVFSSGIMDTQNMLYKQKDPDCSPCGKLFARHLWNDRYFHSGIRYEDLDIIPIITLNSEHVAGLICRLYFYRQHPGSFIHTFNLGRADVLDVTQRLTDYMEMHAPRLVKGARSRQLSANFNIFGLIAAHENDIPEEEIQKAEEISDGCWKKIKELRRESLLNPCVRLKNKIGIILSYIGGRPLLRLFSRHIYR